MSINNRNLVFFTIFLLIFGVLSAEALIIKNNSISQNPKFNDNIYLLNDWDILVDDDGGVDYECIQDAIDNASEDDRIYVFNGTYNENIEINKKITLVGENRDNTIISAITDDSVVSIFEDHVNLSSFTITDSDSLWGYKLSGVYISSNNTKIINNKINCSSYYGLFLDNKNNTLIENNSFFNYEHFGLLVGSGSYNIMIINNFLQGTLATTGIHVSENCNNCLIKGNEIFYNFEGLSVFSTGLTICMNDFTKNTGFGCYIESSYNEIYNNNFYDDGIFFFRSKNNIVYGNYVNDKPLVYYEKRSNKLINNAGQVVLIDCKNIALKNLNLSNTPVGVALINCSDCEISSSKFNFDIIGVFLINSSNTLVFNNFFASQKLEYFGTIELWNSKNNYISCNSISDNFIGVHLYNSKSNNIFNNNIQTCKLGIYIDSSSDNIIQRNCIENTELFGLYFTDDVTSLTTSKCSDNLVIENTIKNTLDTGIKIHPSPLSPAPFNNTFYHNNLINNTNQALDLGANIWNSDYNEGNYWDDYDGTDTNRDGIGDTSYDIADNSKDFFPLMEKYQIVDISMKIAFIDFGKVSVYVTNIGNQAISDFQWSLIVEGGIFGGVNISSNGTIDALEVDKLTKISTPEKSLMYRLGLLTVEATVKAGISEYKKTFYGFVLGRIFIDQTYSILRCNAATNTK